MTIYQLFSHILKLADHISFIPWYPNCDDSRVLSNEACQVCSGHSLDYCYNI